MIDRPAVAPSGVAETTFHKLLSRRAEVRSVESVAGDFRLVTLAGRDLEDRRWTPGNMIQLAFAGWESRAYTPLSYEPKQGRLDFLGYVHGNGIGSEWLCSPIFGEALFLIGPRQGVDLNELRRPALFFGDETSISTAVALLATSPGVRGVEFFFEVKSMERARSAFERFGVHESITCVLREEGDVHLETLERLILERFAVRPEMRGVFTGKSSSIQRLYKALKRSGVPTKQVTNVVYWAPGKKGLSGAQR